MEQNQHSCPACESSASAKHLTVKDHFLTGETFDLIKCLDCELVFTTPRPSSDRIGDYYKSEDYVSHSSTKKGVVNSLYNIVRNYTLEQKLKLVKRLTPGRDLLDIGAGTGHFLNVVSKNGFRATGLEPDEDARRVALEQNNLQLLPVEKLYEQDEASFDVVTMWHVLEHVYDLRKDLHQITSLIRSGGVFIIAVPNHTSFDAEYYKEFWAAYDVPRHLYHFSPASMKKLIEPFGFSLEEQLPMKFDAYYVSMLSEKYKGGSLLNAVKIGRKSNARAGNDKSSSQIYIFRKKQPF